MTDGVKLEAFIFDVYAYAGDEVAFLQGERHADFAPVKNKEAEGRLSTHKHAVRVFALST